MLFTSFEFIFAFLPAVFVGFFLLAKLDRGAAAAWLAAASVVFYGWWNVWYVPLLLGSVAFNYAIGYGIATLRSRGALGKGILVLGIVADLLLLAYFKYTNFFLSEIARPLGVHQDTLDIVLPLGISFFTFTQIAFLVDVWRGKAREYNFVQYLLFVTWFPHLIAGPVLHHGQMIPQFRDPETYRLRSRHLAVGFALFSIGLSKKLLIADPISAFADPVFAAAAGGMPVGFVAGWVGALAYTVQIYFDFSGYSDMAVGLSLLFGIRLPINFNSPYKATNIIDFWRRWHMTLSSFLRDYLYIPLGGSRHGDARRFTNLMATMLLGGLWHGANWTFVVWGGLHGAYLCLNHGFRWLCGRTGMTGRLPEAVMFPLSTLLTFLAVVIAWVFFRADSVGSATTILQGMAAYGEGAHWADVFKEQSRQWFLIYLVVALAIVWLLPNAYEMLERVERRLAEAAREGGRVYERWAMSAGAACATLFCAGVYSTFGTTVTSPFLYFRF